MTGDEFDAWFAYHAAAFTGVLSWLDTFGAGEVTRDSILGHWAKTLADVPYVDAKRATDALAAGDEKFSERGFDSHPRDVRRVSFALRRRRGAGSRAQEIRRPVYVDGRRAYHCDACRDTGFVEVWAKRCVAAARQGRLFDAAHNPAGEYIRRSCAVHCVCELGRIMGGERAVYYDARRMPLYGPIEDSARAYHALMHWIEERPAAEPDEAQQEIPF